jgi:hypothetical protein
MVDLLVCKVLPSEIEKMDFHRMKYWRDIYLAIAKATKPKDGR